MIRKLRMKLARWLIARTSAYGLYAWSNAMDREERVRDILGAQRHESTEEAAWRVTGEQQR